ncbi:MAG: hypothetical protein J6S97_02255 [Bacteroidales bacterium]|nr:hypothetical protein [Bacteroidales bacterium]
MKKILFIIVLALAYCATANAQDHIVTRSGEEINGKVLEVSSDFIRYKRADNPNGPVYVLDIENIRSIQYENGTFEDFGGKISFPGPKEVVPDSYSYLMNQPEVRYADIKRDYNPSYYVPWEGDPYEPWVGGLCSFLIPGLGQCIDGEWGRGLGIFAANVGLGVLEIIEMSAIGYGAQVYNYDYFSGSGYFSDNSYLYGGSGALLITLIGHAALNIWNICDAVRIAKVKNMFYQDFNGKLSSASMKLEPNLALAPSVSGVVVPTAGFSLSLKF